MSHEDVLLIVNSLDALNTTFKAIAAALWFAATLWFAAIGVWWISFTIVSAGSKFSDRRQ